MHYTIKTTQRFHPLLGVPVLSSGQQCSKIRVNRFCIFNLYIVHIHAPMKPKVYRYTLILSHVLDTPTSLPLFSLATKTRRRWIRVHPQLDEKEGRGGRRRAAGLRRAARPASGSRIEGRGGRRRAAAAAGWKRVEEVLGGRRRAAGSRRAVAAGVRQRDRGEPWRLASGSGFKEGRGWSSYPSSSSGCSSFFFFIGSLCTEDVWLGRGLMAGFVE